MAKDDLTDLEAKYGSQEPQQAPAPVPDVSDLEARYGADPAPDITDLEAKYGPSGADEEIGPNLTGNFGPAPVTGNLTGNVGRVSSFAEASAPELDMSIAGIAQRGRERDAQTHALQAARFAQLPPGARVIKPGRVHVSESEAGEAEYNWLEGERYYSNSLRDTVKEQGLGATLVDIGENLQDDLIRVVGIVPALGEFGAGLVHDIGRDAYDVAGTPFRKVAAALTGTKMPAEATTGQHTYTLKGDEKMPFEWRDRSDMAEGRALRRVTQGAKGVHEALSESLYHTMSSVLPDPGGELFGLQQLRDRPIDFMGNTSILGALPAVGLRRAAASSAAKAEAATAAGDVAAAAQWTARAEKAGQAAAIAERVTAAVEPLHLLWRASTNTAGAVGRGLSHVIWGDGNVLATKWRVLTKAPSELMRPDLVLPSGEVVSGYGLHVRTAAEAAAARANVVERAAAIPDDLMLGLEDRFRGLDGDFVVKVPGKPGQPAAAPPTAPPAPPARPVIDPTKTVPVGPVSAAKMQVAVLDDALAQLDELHANTARRMDAALDAGNPEAFALAQQEAAALRARWAEVDRQSAAAKATLEAERAAPSRAVPAGKVPRGTTKEQWKALYEEDYRLATRKQAAREQADRAAAREQVAAATDGVRQDFARLLEAHKTRQVAQQADLDTLLLTDEAIKRIDLSVAAVNSHERAFARVRSRDVTITAAERRAKLEATPVDLLKADEWTRARAAVDNFALAEQVRNVARTKAKENPAALETAETALRTAAQKVGRETAGIRERMIEARKGYVAMAEQMRKDAAALEAKYKVPRTGAERLRAASAKARARTKTPQELAKQAHYEAIAGYARLTEARREALTRIAKEQQAARGDIRKAKAREDTAVKVAEAARLDAEQARAAADAAIPADKATLLLKAKKKAVAAAEAQARVLEAQADVAHATKVGEARALAQPDPAAPPPPAPDTFIPPTEGGAMYATLHDVSKAHGFDIEIAADGTRTSVPIDKAEWAAMDRASGGRYTFLRDNVTIDDLAGGTEGFYVQAGTNGALHPIAQIDPLSPAANAWKIEMLQRGAEAVKRGIVKEDAFWAHAPDYLRDFYRQHMQELGGGGQGAKGGLFWRKIMAPYARHGRLKDLALSDRQALGLISDVRLTLARGQAELISDLALAEYFESLAGARFKGGPLDGVPYAIRTKGGDALHTFHLKSGSTRFSHVKGYGALEDMWVTPDVGRILEATRRIPGWAEKAYLQGMNAWKMGKVPLNPAALWRDTAGTSMLAFMRGLDPILSPAARRGMKGLWRDVTDGTGWDYKRFQAAGGDEGLFIGSDIKVQRALRDIARSNPFEDMGGLGDNPLGRSVGIANVLQQVWGKTGGRLIDGMLWAKGMNDRIFRRWAFRQGIDLLDENLRTGRITPEFRRVFGEEADAVAKLKGIDRDLAAKRHATGVAFDYANIPVAVKWVKNLWLPFFTFQYNSAKAMARYMAERPIEAAFLRASFDTINAMSYTLDGDPMSDEELYDAVAALHSRPSYRSKVGSFYQGQSSYENVGGGNPAMQHRFIDAQWFTIASGWIQPSDELNPSPRRGLLANILGSSQNPLMSIIAAAATGTNPFSGRELDDSPSGAGEGMGEYAWRTVAPTVIAQGIPNIWAAVEGKADTRGRLRTVPEALAAVFAGVKYDLVPVGGSAGGIMRRAKARALEEREAAERDMHQYPPGSTASEERRQRAIDYGNQVKGVAKSKLSDIVDKMKDIRRLQGD